MPILGANTRSLQPLQAQIILNNVPPHIVGYSESCNVAPISLGEDWQAPNRFRMLSSLGPVYREMYRVQCTPYYTGQKPDAGSPKKVIICWAGSPEPGLRPEEVTPGRPRMDSPVWVTCPCRYFRYHCEWALTRYGSSDIIYSNGQAARQTNPKGIGICCKHIFSAMVYSIRHWQEEPAAVQVVEEPAVEVVPQIPVVQQEEAVQEAPVEEQQGVDPTLEEREEPAPPRGASVADRIRSLVFSYEQECC